MILSLSSSIFSLHVELMGYICITAVTYICRSLPLIDAHAAAAGNSPRRDR